MKEILEKLSELAGDIREIKVNQTHNYKLLEKHEKTLKDQQSTLIRNTTTVEAHHKRSTLLETEMKTIKEHVYNIQGVGKFVRWVSWVGGAVAIIYSIFKFVSGGF